MSREEIKDTVFVGDGAELVPVFDRLKRPDRVLGVFCNSSDSSLCGVPCLGTVLDVPDFLKENNQIRRLYCSSSEMDVSLARTIQDSCKMRGVKFCLALPVVNDLDGQFVPMSIGMHLLLTPQSEPLSKFYNQLSKRLVDILFSLVLLLTVFPVVYLVKYIKARIRKSGALLGVERCFGPNGRAFNRVRFCDSDERAGIDRMPMLFNVLTGSMSLVGPAPSALNEDVDNVDNQHRLERRFMKSGMMGWAQVKGNDPEHSLRDDIWYVEHWSLWLDLRIMAQSLF